MEMARSGVLGAAAAAETSKMLAVMTTAVQTPAIAAVVGLGVMPLV